MKSKEWVLIIDAYYLCYKAYYTMPRDFSFNEHDTNIIYGFLNQLKTLVQQIKPDKLVFCFDSPKSYRKLEYPPYKQRNDNKSAEDKENLRIAKKQFAELEDVVLPALGFRNIYSQVGYEADDLIAELCYRFPDDYIIVSADEDLLQLLSDGFREVKLYLKGKKMMTRQDFIKAFGIEPYKWRMVKAIAGCKTDTVEGVEGVGDIKAVQYLKGDMHDGKIKDRIEQSQDIIRRNLRLVSLPYLGLKPIHVIQGYPSQDVLYAGDFLETFSNYGFNSFVAKFDEWRALFDLRDGNRKKDV